jgi:hypothetical protein
VDLAREPAADEPVRRPEPAGDLLGGAAPAAGVEILRGAVSTAAVDGVLRLLHLDLLQRGASAAELGSWLWDAHWFPHLNYDPAVLAMADELPHTWRTGIRCDPQILLQFPHVGPEPAITFHVDREPEWAAGRTYCGIVGVALSPWHAANGGLLVRSAQGAVAIELDPGDAVMMAPDVLHSSGINRTGEIRYAVYFRWLDERSPNTAISSSRRRLAVGCCGGAGRQT